jgi:hypothetical protein
MAPVAGVVAVPRVLIFAREAFETQYISEILRKHQENVSHVATHWTCPALHLRRWDMPSANSYLHLVGEVLTARGIAEEKPSENIMVAAASSLLLGFSDRFQAGETKHDYTVLTHLGNRGRGVGCLFGCASVCGKRGSRTGSVAGTRVNRRGA